MFLTDKIVRVIALNKNLDSRQTILLQCIYFKKSWYKSPILALFSFAATSYLIYVYRLLGGVNKYLRGIITLGMIITFLFIVIGAIELLLYEYKRGQLLDIYGTYPKRLEIVVVNNINQLLSDGTFPPEYYAIDWDIRCSRGSDR